MITRKITTSTTSLTPRLQLCSKCCSQRFLHARASQPSIPPSTPFVPDAATFLSLIGRGLSQHAKKIPDWQSLFTLSSTQLRDLGVEPARTRRYLLWWRDKFRKGITGIGGDLKHVKDGEAELRVVEVAAPKAQGSSTRQADLLAPLKRLVVNEPAETPSEQLQLDEVKPVEGMRVKGAGIIVGPHVSHVKGSRGSVARIKAQEGMWEVRRGVKVDGGERRKLQVRRKRLLEERRTTRAK
ncbi:MAG: telomere length regulation protein [Ramalina farinacea]|uniref:Small ribosomal subunit protein mS41 n=1 Tax=Ramalina farinacea TaxID=258253 RepID=A0AA43QVH5_9LECA|nr:telomere length regulation protein [Ramalina farinacea]